MFNLPPVWLDKILHCCRLCSMHFGRSPETKRAKNRVICQWQQHLIYHHVKNKEEMIESFPVDPYDYDEKKCSYHWTDSRVHLKLESL